MQNKFESIPTVNAIESGQRVIVRGSCNVPVENEQITDDYRLTKLVPLISDLRERGAVTVIMAHIGRAKDETLLAVSDYLQQHAPVIFVPGFFAAATETEINHNIQNLADTLAAAEPGTVILLDNVRATDLEKSNDTELAEKLAELFDVYVNEAFAVCHRQHMSVDALPRAITKKGGLCCMGPTLAQEIDVLSKALHPAPGSIGVISGNKFDTKLPLIERFLEHYQTVVVGGALLNTLFAVSGHTVGRSLIDDSLSDESRERLQKVLDHDHLYLPELIVVENTDSEREKKHVLAVEDDDAIYDVDPAALDTLAQISDSAPLLVWNGPLGYYEKGYSEGTERMLDLFTQSQGMSIIGGGNTVDVTRDLGRAAEVGHLSTGGGAMIDYLSTGTLPALEALLS